MKSSAPGEVRLPVVSRRRLDFPIGELFIDFVLIYSTVLPSTVLPSTCLCTKVKTVCNAQLGGLSTLTFYHGRLIKHLYSCLYCYAAFVSSSVSPWTVYLYMYVCNAQLGGLSTLSFYHGRLIIHLTAVHYIIYPALFPTGRTTPQGVFHTCTYTCHTYTYIWNV